MKVTQVTVHFGCKVSKNYNSTEASVSYQASLDEGENPDFVAATLHKQAKTEVARQLREALK